MSNPDQEHSGDKSPAIIWKENQLANGDVGCLLQVIGCVLWFFAYIVTVLRCPDNLGDDKTFVGFIFELGSIFVAFVTSPWALGWFFTGCWFMYRGGLRDREYLTWRCPHCGSTHSVSEALAKDAIGSEVTCPVCVNKCIKTTIPGAK